jgi:hypothetical protein
MAIASRAHSCTAWKELDPPNLTCLQRITLLCSELGMDGPVRFHSGPELSTFPTITPFLLQATIPISCFLSENQLVVFLPKLSH